MNLDEIRLKSPTNLSDEEKEFIKANQDQLEETEKWMYEDILEDKTEAVETEEEVKPEETKEEEPKEDLEALIDQKVEERIKRLNLTEKQAEVERTKGEALKEKWFDDDYKPKDANELVGKVMEVIDKRQQKQSELSSKQVQALNEEYDLIVSTNKLPDPSSDEGAKIKESIRNLGVKHGKQNFSEAFDLWKIVPETHGGGFKVEAEDTEKVQKKEQLAKQKSIAGKSGGGSGSADKGKQMSYQHLHETSLDKLIDEELGS